jgi:hypothetical protein
VPLAPQAKEALVDLGPRQGQHHQRLVAQNAQGGIDVVDAGEVAPVQIFQQQKHGVVVGLGFQPVDPGRHGLIRHQARIPARGLQLGQIVVGKANVGDLAQKGRRGRRALGRQKRVVCASRRLRWTSSGSVPLMPAAPRRAWASKSQRDVDAHGIAAADEQLEAVPAVALAFEKLVDHARLAAARGAAEHCTAWARGSSTQASNRLSSSLISRSRPRQGISWPKTVRGASRRPFSKAGARGRRARPRFRSARRAGA